MAKPDVELTSGIKFVGLDKLKSSSLAAAEVMIEPLLLLAAGASKTEAAFAGVKSAIEYKVLGPIGAISGLAGGALIAIQKLALGFAELGKESAASLEMIEVQFKPLLKSATLAAERVQELIELTKETPFEQEGVLQANRNLQILSQGAMATKDKMLLVGDASAMAGKDIGEVSEWVGRLYDALQSGTPIGRASLRLQQLGIITGTTRRALESMNDSGAAFSDMWSMVEHQLGKAEGSMDDLSKTLTGLQSTYSDTADILKASFSEGFAEGQKASLMASIKTMEALTPVAKDLGAVFGWLPNKMERWKTAILGTVAGAERLGKAIKLGVVSVLVVLSSAFLTGAVSATIFVAKMGGVIASLHAAKASATATGGALGFLAAAMHKVGVATVWVTQKLVAFALSMVTSGMFWFIAALGAITAGLIHFNSEIQKAAKRVKEFSDATRALNANITSQIRSVRTLNDLMKVQNRIINDITEARKKLQQAEVSGDTDMIAELKKRIAELQNRLGDVNNFDTKDLGMTEEELNRAKKQAADKATREAQEREQARTDMSPEERYTDSLKEVQRIRMEQFKANQSLEIEEDNKKTKRDEEAVRKGIAAEISLIQPKFELAAEKQDLLRQALGDEKFNSLDFGSERGKKEIAGMIENNLQGLRQGADLADVQKSMGVTVGDHFSRNGSATAGAPTRAKEKIAAWVEEIAKVNEYKEALDDLYKRKHDPTILDKRLNSDDEITRLRARMSVRAQEAQILDNIDKMEANIANLKNDDSIKEIDKPAKVSNLEGQLGRLKDEHKALVRSIKLYNKRAVAAGNDAIERTPRAQSDDAVALHIAENKRDKFAGEAGKILSNEAKQKAKEDRKALETSAAALLDIEIEMAKLKHGGLLAELKILDISKRRLEMTKETTNMGEGEYRRQKKILELKEEGRRKEAAAQTDTAQAQLAIREAKRREDEARRDGDKQNADLFKFVRFEIEEDELEKELNKKAKGMVFGSDADRQAFIQESLESHRKVRQQKEAWDEEDRRREGEQIANRDRVAALRMRESMERMGGNRGAAEATKREADALEDAQKRRDLINQYRGRGFENAEEMADRAVRGDQLKRQLNEISNDRHVSITASSLARIGGGGGVGGVDNVVEQSKRMVALQQDMRKYLETIAKNSGPNDGNPPGIIFGD